MKPDVLLVDDDPAICISFRHYLERVGFNILEAGTMAEGREALSGQRLDAILLDLNLPDGNGMDWIIELRETCPHLSIIVITGAGEISLAVEAMRRGADHFLTKPVNMPDLEVFLRKSLELGALRRSTFSYQRLQKKPEMFQARSARMGQAMEMAALAAERGTPVLLTGETGSGKGVLARWICDHGPRRTGAFVDVNCSSLRGELLAAELFGHVRGAFTSAVETREGLLDVADGGTLFLDEVGDMDLGIQAQFLKVLEEKRFRRLGDTRERHSEFHLICATNRDLQEEIRCGRFRKELFFRINVLPVPLPPLRERMEDFDAFTRHLLARLGAPEREITPDAVRLLKAYSWPGNVRELRNVLERALLLARGGPLAPEHFHSLNGSELWRGTNGVEDSRALEALRIRGALDRHSGNAELAAKEIGISRATLYRKLKRAENRKIGPKA